MEKILELRAACYADDVPVLDDMVADWTEARISGRAGVRMPGGLDVNTSTPSALYNIAKGEGFGALFAGVVPRVAKVAPSCAIMIASYEAGKSFFRRRREAAQQEASVS